MKNLLLHPRSVEVRDAYGWFLRNYLSGRHKFQEAAAFSGERPLVPSSSTASEFTLRRESQQASRRTRGNELVLSLQYELRCHAKLPEVGRTCRVYAPPSRIPISLCPASSPI